MNKTEYVYNIHDVLLDLIYEYIAPIALFLYRTILYVSFILRLWFIKYYIGV